MKERILSLREILKKGEAALVTSETNRFYLSGFHSSDGAILITNDSAVLFEDFRYFEKAKKEVKSLETVLSEKLFSQIKERLIKENIKTVYIETGSVSLEAFGRYKELLSDFCVSESPVLSDKLSEMRAVKSETEIRNIIKAQELTDKTFEYILGFIKPGLTETEVALEMEFFMRKLGSEGVSFDFIVVSGKNSSLPHGVPTDKKIEKGDFVTMDFGAVVNGYRSDMTRTVAVGNISEKQKAVYETVLKAQETALSKIKAGEKCKDIDKTARDFIENSGYKGCFGHGLGHSVGLEIHESPCFNTRDETVLKSGTVMTVEPGIYLENQFGVRIEDMVVVTENGYLNLTKSPKNLINI